MKRREFLKGMLGVGSIVAIPMLAEKPFVTKYTHASYPLYSGVIDMTGDVDLPSQSQDNVTELFQEGMDILESIEYV